MRKRILQIYGIAIVCGVIYFALIKLNGSGIPCFYKETTGLLCPGCGASDMLVALSEFKILQAFSYNPLVFALLLLWTAVAIFCFVKNRIRQGDKRILKILLIASIASSIAFSVIRNIY